MRDSLNPKGLLFSIPPFMIAYYVDTFSPYLLRIYGDFGLRWYGLAYVTAFLIGIWIVRIQSRRGYCRVPEKEVSDFIIGAAIFGVLIGGRLGYMLLYDFGNFIHEPWIIFQVWKGGMASHGGIIGITLYTWWYAKKHNIPWRNVSDCLAVAAPLGLFLGRMANFVNGELYGRVIHGSVPWGMQFPKELITSDSTQEMRDLAVQEATKINPAWYTPEAVVDVLTINKPEGWEKLREAMGGVLNVRHPSQIYEGCLEGLFLFGLLWFLRTRFRLADGVLSGVFFIVYALVRCLCEMFREPDAALTGPFTRGQFLSLFLVLIGVAFLISTRIRPIYPPARKER